MASVGNRRMFNKANKCLGISYEQKEKVKTQIVINDHTVFNN